MGMIELIKPLIFDLQLVPSCVLLPLFAMFITNLFRILDGYDKVSILIYVFLLTFLPASTRIKWE